MTEALDGASSRATFAAQDRAGRERALDITRSFLVQAPAGSGKTALLIQRFLALLAHVDRPERIVAMTFTRKAAAEMRERIVGALRSAAAGETSADAHLQRTLELARHALAQDARQGWQLSAHPSRLQLLTIDALCAGIMRQAPLGSGLAATSRFDEQPTALYDRAARDALRAAAADDGAWRNLLVHLDNDAEHAVAQLARMLATREQWLPELPLSDPDALRARLEATLAAEICGELQALRSAFPHELSAALAACERYAAGCLENTDKDAARAKALQACAAAGGLPPPTVDALLLWRELAAWLLVGNGTAFRKMVDVNAGFPPKGTEPGAAERAAVKARMQGLLGQFAAVPGLARALAVAIILPPARYGEDAWSIVAALARILRVCAAELLLAFNASGTIDFPQLTLAALDALGEADAPSDLLLLVDRRLDHLLIDEFQDTSFSQLELIRRLTAGWEEGDGRTLFAVGDPMQSIYRFRQAEVRFFVEAQRDARIAEIPVECITLRRNFRSRPALVDWFNGTFPRVLGAVSDPWRSVVAFEPATATREAGAGRERTFDLVADPDAEATLVIEQARKAIADGAREVAILVRARNHLDRVLPALRRAELPFAAIELDALSDRTVVLDLVSLTHALMQPADRLAWLSVLRAPWCGLTLPDLFAVASAAEAERVATLADPLSSTRALAALSSDGRARFERIAESLAIALSTRGRATLAARVRGAWLALGGPACLDDALDVDAAEQFLALLSEHEQAGELTDWRAFLGALDELRAVPAPVAEQRSSPPLQVMTLHRAKGLEFDTVIIPGLARTTPRGNAQLLRWRQRLNGVLLAPMRPRGGDKDPVYEYLTVLEREEEDAELGRLLYVGCTRAKERLHLIAALDTKVDPAGAVTWKSPPAGSALAKLWDAAAPGPPPMLVRPAPSERESPPLRRLPLAWRAPTQPLALPAPSQLARHALELTLAFDWARETARHVGTVAHRVFKQIGEEGLEAWPAERITALAPRLAAELASEGVAASDMEQAIERVQGALRSCLADPRGRWLFASEHRDAHSEYALTAIRNGELVNVVLDRTFLDAEGTRWIVDFKFSPHEGAGLDAFLDSERERYRAQLEGYAEALRALDERPLRLGLYFPLLAGWRELPVPR